jgi:hypothetical protein
LSLHIPPCGGAIAVGDRLGSVSLKWGMLTLVSIWFNPLVIDLCTVDLAFS